MKKQQVICFIDPGKFGALLGDTCNKIGFRENGAFLGNDTRVLYAGKDGQCEVGSFDPDRAASAQIIFVPDRLGFTYEPRVDFKVLHHTHTPRAQVARLEGLRNWFRGSKQFIEHPDTIYGTIARQIKSGNIDFDLIWNGLSDEFVKAEIERFCSSVLFGNDLSTVHLPDCLKQFSTEYDKFKSIIGSSYETDNPKHLDAYETFRKQLSRI